MLVYRNPDMTPGELKDHYENIHIPLMKSLAGPVFPIKHTRHYVGRATTAATIAEDGEVKYPATIYTRKQADFEFDCFIELEFESEAAFHALSAILGEPDAAPLGGKGLPSPCDELGGIKDGVISMIDAFGFDPDSTIGKKIDCHGKPSEITKNTERIVKAVLQGLVDPQGEQLFPGATHGTLLTGLMALGNTLCNEDGICKSGQPFTLATDWIRLLLKKDPSFDPASMSHQECADPFRQSVRKFDALIGSNDADLREFNQAGKKMISWHSINDEAITVKAIREYYERVTALDTARGIDTESYFRYFEVAGTTHCSVPNGGHYPCMRWRFCSSG
ncbi:hypothetical protein QQX98_000891 [Neonectria punicea]|uniref:Carboxylic ester hydrolase n=1 Tax=Neonectria punicea TaxID=979145 RepID=A0ABR1HRD2_9HYPO